MKFWGIVRFELGCQLRRPWPWLFIAVLLVLCFLMTRDNALAEALLDEFDVNSPFAIAKTMVFGSLLWLLLAPAVAGEAAARDVATGMHPLVYTAPVSKAEYLGGRLLAALILNGLILLAVPVAILLGVYLPGVPAELIAPFRPAGYVTAFAFVVLPNAFVATAIQFLLASRSGRTMAGYAGSLLLIFMGFFVASLLLYKRGLGKLLDPIGVRFILDDLSHMWTTAEKNSRLLELTGALLGNRVLWVVVALVALGVTWVGFRFAHRVDRSWWTRWRRPFASLRAGSPDAHSPVPARIGVAAATPAGSQAVERTFGLIADTRKTLAIARESFRTVATSWPGLALLTAVPLVTVLVVLSQTVRAGVPLLPTTARVVMELTGSLSDELSRWLIIPLLTVFFAGELVWRERDAGVDEIRDAMPGSEWPALIGKFLGLGLLLAVSMASLAAAGMIGQALRGYHHFEIGLYAKILLGLQLPDYLLFAMLALAVHVLVDQKYIGHLVAILAYVFIVVLAGMLGVEHNLLVYGNGPGWSYTEMRGFGPSLGPWLWFKLYWAAWALLLAVAAKLVWVRGRERGLGVRIRLARQRLTRSTAGVASAAVLLILALGGFIFYNTNVLNEYLGSSAISRRSAEYERLYRRYENLPQPALTAASLRVEIYPGRRAVEVRGSYRLVNPTAMPIDSILVATAMGGVETGAITFDRPATLAVGDDRHGQRIYALASPLPPGDTLRLEFAVNVRPRGFRQNGAGTSVVANGSYFSGAWLPSIGYQSIRELISAGDRRTEGLPPRPVIASLSDIEAGVPPARRGGVAFEAVVGTEGDQVAVAPGALRRSWTEGGRRYFQYSTDAPIAREWAFFSARYAVREGRWKDVVIRIYHHPAHTANLARMMQGVESALDYYSREFGPYPYRHLTLVEIPGNGVGLHAEPSFFTYSEGYAAWVPRNEKRLDFPHAVLAHETAHQWTVPYARVEGAPFLSEGLAWYSAMLEVKESRGADELHQLLATMRDPELRPEIRRGEPLLRALDPYMSYRKGPFAMYALSEYIGADRVNRAIRRLIAAHDSPGTPLTTTLDLYRELQAVTPDSLRYLLHDLFEVNMYWKLETERATATQTPAGTWQVTLDVRARKVLADSAGNERTVPMDEWIEIGVFAEAGQGGELSAPVYLGKRRIRSGAQRISVTVSRRPALAGIDPYHLLDWQEQEDDDNIDAVKVVGAGSGD